ncbi:MAG: hypothetical protein ABIJ16_09435 [Bacteroidota bacterium]
MTIERAILKIEAIDKKINPLEQQANGILSSSGVGQAPPVFHSTLDKIIVLKEKQAKIWNELRHHVFSGRTFWQRAIESDLPVVRFGQETMLNFSGADIRTLLTELKPLHLSRK